jgi:putative endonuclease
MIRRRADTAEPAGASAVRPAGPGLGKVAEDAALAYLTGQGLRLETRNYSCKGGEIDLIMRDNGVLVFVEVRQRTGASHGDAAASITPAKQRRLTIAAQTYLLRLKTLPPCRFDAVTFDGTKLSWLQNIL